MIGSLLQRFRSLGPGIVLAASGIGAGDVVVASVTGIRHGMTLLWAVVFTAALKFALTESLARWQLATGETVVRAWATRLPRWVSILFGGYLLFWTFMVGASLSAACGLVGSSVFPALSVPAWGAIHALVAAALVAANRYAQFQRVMKGLVAVMALSVLACALLTRPAPGALLQGLFVPHLPAEGGGAQVLALLGGIGGSVTVICYAYWMRAAAWRGREKLATVRGDVRLAYLFTGLFGIALVVVAAGVHGSAVGGARMALEIAERLQGVGGVAARWVFLIGFWCTVFTAMLGVWQGVPQIYVDLVSAWRGREVHGAGEAAAGDERKLYLAALAYLAGPPLILLWHKEPVAVVVAFSIAGAFFMPFLAATLLYLNNRREWVGDLANRWLGNTALVVSLVVFGAVSVAEVVKALSS
ncbi:MAG TPA: Nramp family divalent metal transporter [Opitutaceae bacterium]